MVLRYLWPAILWSIVVLFLTLLPGEEFPEVQVVGIDKLVHFFIFGLVMVLSSFGLYKISAHTGAIQNPVLISFFYSITFGVAIEILQLFVPNRNFSLLDIIANVIGVALGYLLFNFWKK